MASSTWPTAAPALSTALRRRVDATRSSVTAVAALLPRSVPGLPFWDDSLDQVVSTRWRGHGAAPVSIVAAAGRWATTATKGIRVVGQDTNFLADEGILQVTVVNDLTEPVSGLVLRLSPSSPRLRVLEQPAAFPIAARSRATVRVRVRAVAAGLVPVTVSLQSRDGLAVGTLGPAQHPGQPSRPHLLPRLGRPARPARRHRRHARRASPPSAGDRPVGCR